MLTTTERQAIKELYYAGENPEAIAEQLGLDELAVMTYVSSTLFPKPRRR